MARNLEKPTSQSNQRIRTQNENRHKSIARRTQHRASAGAKLSISEKRLEESEQQEVGPREKAQIADMRSVTYIRVFFTLVLLGLFGWLNYEVIALVRDIFEKTGSLDKHVIMTLIGGTVSEVAAVMYIIARFLFPKARE